MNDWAKVVEIIRLKTPIMFKINLKAIEMADRAMINGIQVGYQLLQAQCVAREVSVRLSPCFNCFSYNHLIRECKQPKQSVQIAVKGATVMKKVPTLKNA